MELSVPQSESSKQDMFHRYESSVSGLFAPRNGSAREQKVLILFRMYIAQYAHLIIVIC